MRHARHLRTTHDYQFGKLQLASAGAAESESAMEAIDENVRIEEKSNCRPASILEIKCDIDGAQIEMAGLSI